MDVDEELKQLRKIRRGLESQKTWYPIVMLVIFAVFAWWAGANDEPLTLLLLPVVIVLVTIVVLLFDIRIHLMRVEISELKKENWEEHERELWTGDS